MSNHGRRDDGGSKGEDGINLKTTPLAYLDIVSKENSLIINLKIRVFI